MYHEDYPKIEENSFEDNFFYVSAKKYTEIEKLYGPVKKNERHDSIKSKLK